jgi:SNF2 family DNA or RNA helicase
MGTYQDAIYKVLGAKVLSDVVSQPAEREKLRRWRSAKMVRLLQAASNPSLLSERSIEFKLPPLSASGLSVSEIISRYSEFEQPAKLIAARDLVRELVNRGHKVVLWSVFVHNLKVLANLLEEFEPRVIHGSIPKDSSEDSDINRELLIHQFKTAERYPLLIANPGACAESISLHKICKHAVYVDRTFNGAQYMQSLDRIHRLGLRPHDKVHYYMLSAIDSLDEVVDSRLEEKHKKLLTLLEGDLLPVDLDDQSVSEETEEAMDFELLIAHLKQRFGQAGSR